MGNFGLVSWNSGGEFFGEKWKFRRGFPEFGRKFLGGGENGEIWAGFLELGGEFWGSSENGSFWVGFVDFRSEQFGDQKKKQPYGASFA